MVKNKILFLFLFPPPPEKILEKIREPNNKKSLALCMTQVHYSIYHTLQQKSNSKNVRQFSEIKAVLSRVFSDAIDMSVRTYFFLCTWSLEHHVVERSSASRL
jgi:hypothetical protein